MQQTRFAQKQRKAARKGRPFCLRCYQEEHVTKLLTPIETDESVSVKLPARQRVLIVVPLTLLAASCFYGVIWWGYRWLSATASVSQSVANLSMWALITTEAVALRFLLLELATTLLTFERTTIEVQRSVLCVRIARDWYSCYRVKQFLVTHDAKHPDVIRLDLFLDKGGRTLMAANIPTETFVFLINTLRRKDFAYLTEEEST